MSHTTGGEKWGVQEFYQVPLSSVLDDVKSHFRLFPIDRYGTVVTRHCVPILSLSLSHPLILSFSHSSLSTFSLLHPPSQRTPTQLTLVHALNRTHTVTHQRETGLAAHLSATSSAHFRYSTLSASLARHLSPLPTAVRHAHPLQH